MESIKQKALRLSKSGKVIERTDEYGRVFEVEGDSGLIHTVKIIAKCGCDNGKYRDKYCSHILGCMEIILVGIK